MVPFALALAFVVGLAGAGAALTAWQFGSRELEAHASAARHLLGSELRREKARLAPLAASLASSSSGTASRRDREDKLAGFTDRNRIGLAAVYANGRVIGADGPGGLAGDPFVRRLVRRANARGRIVTATLRTRGGQLAIVAATPGSAGGPAAVVGRGIDLRLLRGVERPLDALLYLTPAGGRQPATPEGVRSFDYRLRLDDGTPMRLYVSVAEDRLQRALWAALIAAAAAGVLAVAGLMFVLARLLRGSVVAPLARLRSGMRQIEDGHYGTRVRPSGADEVRVLAGGFNDMATLVERQRDHLKTLADTDPLTGLANHKVFHERIAALGEDRPFAVAILDLDHFKVLNDTHGHLFGDHVLREVGLRLRAVAGPENIVGRLGGEEFGVLIPDGDGTAALRLAERARAEIGEIDSQESSIDCSAGVAAYPRDTDDPGALVELADGALYRAKRSGRGRVYEVDPAADASTLAKGRAVIRALLDAPDQLVPVFQPIVSLATGGIAGYEGLSRVPSAPGRRTEEWFDLARAVGMGPELQALAIRRMLAVGDRPADTFVAVNVDVAAVVSDHVLDAVGSDPSGVVVEITEHELTTAGQGLQRVLARLRALGARIALDDAGAGYAGLQHLVELRPDIIKLDRSLVAGVDGDSERLALIEAFVAYTHRTGTVLCAEGIETEAELAALTQAGVDLGQGYLLASPAEPWVRVSPVVSIGHRDTPSRIAPVLPMRPT